MSRDFQIPGECLVQVKGMVGTGIANLSQLGLSSGPIQVRVNPRHRDINLDAWGGEVPADKQFMLADVMISMMLIHFDPDILDICIRESMAGATAAGRMVRAGTRLGGGVARFAIGNHYIGLNLTSPVNNKPYRFLYSHILGPSPTIPLGTEKQMIPLTWHAIPYTTDPWNAGLGAGGHVLWDNTLDT